MKSNKFILAAALGLAITGAGVAQDQNQGPKHRGRPGAALHARMLQRFDTDGDGKLSDVEKAAAAAQFPKLHNAMLALLDTDGDGQISDAEIAVAKEQFQARLKAMRAQYDTDGDGKLSPEERKAAMEAFLQERPR
ncbi:MAG: EF-hand domain-containing protein [Verrucomicrobia bacterium]|nr:EF-hand domain-containing protein [Verrucomicrobiota bacterium]